MFPSLIPWWAWLLIAAACWFIQLVLSISTDKGKGWFVRILFIAAMVVSAAIGIIRFVKWAWRG